MSVAQAKGQILMERGVKVRSLPQLSGPGPPGLLQEQTASPGAALAELGPQPHGVPAGPPRWRPAYRRPLSHSSRQGPYAWVSCWKYFEARCQHLFSLGFFFLKKRA